MTPATAFAAREDFATDFRAFGFRPFALTLDFLIDFLAARRAGLLRFFCDFLIGFLADFFARFFARFAIVNLLNPIFKQFACRGPAHFRCNADHSRRSAGRRAWTL
ncbi:MAG: hypothetical protein WD207_08905 [Xanthobacteraceae bacterium]